MTTKYFAHSGTTSDKSDWQPLSDHLKSAGALAAQNARFFGASQLAEVCGLLHDLGKYSSAFAKRLEGGPRVDHATAGAKVAMDRWPEFGKLLAFTIAGHHAGLANGIDQGDQRSTLEERLQRTIPELDRIWETEIRLPEKLNLPQFKSVPDQQGFQIAFLVRMLFSCLIDADRLDTERFYLALEGKEPNRNNFVPINTLQRHLIEYLNDLSQKFTNAEPDSVNGLRNHILTNARAQAKLEPGLFSLTVPTGGGKTLTSMAFALDHAVHYQLRRVIYVIPFTSIIEQNANVFREVFKPLGEDIVLEHHGTFDDDSFDWKEDTKDKLRLAMENWDAPIIVTTAVQFFETLFTDRTSKSRKLHNIAGSVIIFDEAQTLPEKLLRPTMEAINELARNYRCSLVLCTATQPALKKSDDFHNGFEQVREIAPNPERLYRLLDRVSVRHIGAQTDVQLVDRLLANHQVLIIVNNRRHARALFDAIGAESGHFHLTTLMCANHRKEKLEQVRRALKENRPCRLISTSLIECGVDVDFPLVLRAESGLDSIAQAAGRCNREGKRPKSQSEVLIFTAPDWKPPSELERRAASMRSVLRQHSEDLLAPMAIRTFFKHNFWQLGPELDAKKLLKLHRQQARTFDFAFQDIAKLYRIIDNPMRPIIVPRDEEAKKWVSQLRYAEFVGKLARRLQPYIVQIPVNGFLALKEAEVIEVIAEERFGDQFWVLINQDIYSDNAGLSWDEPTYLAAENCVII